MKINMKLARVGMNMQEATISKWHRQPGETFAKGDVLYEIETEKVTQEIEAPGAGRLLEIRAAAQTEAQVGEVVCVVELEPGG